MYIVDVSSHPWLIFRTLSMPEMINESLLWYKYRPVIGIVWLSLHFLRKERWAIFFPLEIRIFSRRLRFLRVSAPYQSMIVLSENSQWLLMASCGESVVSKGILSTFRAILGSSSGHYRCRRWSMDLTLYKYRSVIGSRHLGFTEVFIILL